MEKARGGTRDVGMSVYWTGSASGAVGSRDLCVWPLLSALRMSSSIFIDPLWLMSPATGRIKLQRSHTSQGEREAGRVRERMSDAEKVSGDDKRAQVSDKMRAKRSQTPKGQSLGACGGLGSLLRLESATHKTCRGNISAKIKTGTPVENKQT